MRTKEIPRDEWMLFLDGFSRRHEGWLVTLEDFAPDVGAQELASELPLESITTPEPNDPETISISVGNTPANHLRHIVNAPTRLWLKQTAQGADEALEIESTDGTKTLLRFRSAMPAEMVDGLVSA